jgi:predicted transposase YdaD
MAGEFDPVLKALVETAPADWLPLLGRRRRRVSLQDADIATVVSGAADKVLRVHDDPPYLVHLDFQAGHDTSALPPRLKLYNSALEYRHDALVWSVAVLLRPEADSPQLTGSLARGFAGEDPVSTLRYQVVRVWQLSAEQLLAGGLGTLPLAPVSDAPRQALPRVIQRMQERLREPKAQRLAPDLWAATFVLLGLRYDEEFAQTLLRGVLAMKESTTYQAILAEGRAEGRAEGEAKAMRRVLLMLGEQRFGAPADAASRAAVEAIGEVERLEDLVKQVSQAASWQELLASAAQRRRNGRRKGKG